MANTIKHKRSNSSGAVPNPSDLEDGEIALNTADGEIFFKKQDGTVKPVASDAEDAAIAMAIAPWQIRSKTK